MPAPPILSPVFLLYFIKSFMVFLLYCPSCSLVLLDWTLVIQHALIPRDVAPRKPKPSPSRPNRCNSPLVGHIALAVLPRRADRADLFPAKRGRSARRRPKASPSSTQAQPTFRDPDPTDLKGHRLTSWRFMPWVYDQKDNARRLCNLIKH